MFVLMLSKLGAFTVCPAENKLSDTRVTLEKWVETRQLISKTKAEWQADKETLEQMLELLTRELETVTEQLSKVSTNSTQVATEQAEALKLKSQSAAALDEAKRFAAKFEAEIAKCAPRMPAPLQELLKPLLNRLPANPEATRMSAAERIQVVVGVLNEIDKFNSGITIFSEKRKNNQGEEIAVETVYVGLGAAYFVNETGEFAGVGAPGATKWEWTINSALAPAVREVIQIYRNEKPARFVPLPVAIR